MLLSFLEGFLQVFLIVSVVELSSEVTAVAIGKVPVYDLDVDGTNHYF